MSVFLTSLHVWITFGTDRELQNTVEIGKLPPEKVYLNLPTFRRELRLTNFVASNSLPVGKHQSKQGP